MGGLSGPMLLFQIAAD
ncbi:DUF6053 domain-containing protein [Lysobacter yananisis]